MMNKILIIVFFVCSLCHLSYAAGLLSEEAYNHFNEGVRAQRAGDYKNAQTNYQRALIIDKDTQCRKFIFNNSALMYINDGRTDKAEWAFKEALKIDPNYKVAALNLSLLYLQLAMHYKDQGSIEGALDNLEKAYQFYSEKTFIMEKEIDIDEEKYHN